tara:strand:+ start:475 stop:732 length:258 start_codon:yes stop_codon:yes gene_type:complete
VVLLVHTTYHQEHLHLAEQVAVAAEQSLVPSPTNQAHQWQELATLVETSGAAVAVVEKEMQLVVVMVVMELLLLHMMPLQHLSVP